jgi:hypothetical protein
MVAESPRAGVAWAVASNEKLEGVLAGGAQFPELSAGEPSYGRISRQRLPPSRIPAVQQTWPALPNSGGTIPAAIAPKASV